MFRLIFSKSRTNCEVASSKLFDELSFYRAFERDLKRAKKTVFIECPFLTERRSAQLSRHFVRLRRKGVKIVIYTRNPWHHPPRLRDQAIKSIAILRGAGVIVYECRDYRHRKVAIIDKRMLWEGSLNILSQSKSRELMRRIDSALLAKQTLRLIKDYR